MSDVEVLMRTIQPDALPHGWAVLLATDSLHEQDDVITGNAEQAAFQHVWGCADCRLEMADLLEGIGGAAGEDVACAIFTTLLPIFVRDPDALRSDLRGQLQEHLESCSDCRMQWVDARHQALIDSYTEAQRAAAALTMSLMNAALSDNAEAHRLLAGCLAVGRERLPLSDIVQGASALSHPRVAKDASTLRPFVIDSNAPERDLIHAGVEVLLPYTDLLNEELGIHLPDSTEGNAPPAIELQEVLLPSSASRKQSPIVRIITTSDSEANVRWPVFGASTVPRSMRLAAYSSRDLWECQLPLTHATGSRGLNPFIALHQEAAGPVALHIEPPSPPTAAAALACRMWFEVPHVLPKTAGDIHLADWLRELMRESARKLSIVFESGIRYRELTIAEPGRLLTDQEQDALVNGFPGLMVEWKSPQEGAEDEQ